MLYMLCIIVIKFMVNTDAFTYIKSRDKKITANIFNGCWIVCILG